MQHNNIEITEPAPNTEQSIATLKALIASIAARVAQERAAAVQSSDPPAMKKAA